MYGIDVGGTKIEIAIFDQNGEKKECWRTATPTNDYSNFLSTVGSLVEEADEKTESKGSVGIGLPGFVDNFGKATSSNIPCINGQLLAKDISQQLGRTVGFQNDVKAFVYSEAHGGSGKGFKHVLGVVLGTGVAGGLCINGEIYEGRQNIAGEYGHIVLPTTLQQKYSFPIRQCGCGAMGCVEQYLSGPALLWMSGFFGGSYLSVSELIVDLRSGSDLAVKIFDAYIDCLGCYFAELTMMFDPDVIVLGGGLSNIDEIYAQVPQKIQNYLFDSATPPKVLKPMYGDSSGVRGAALIGSHVANK